MPDRQRASSPAGRVEAAPPRAMRTFREAIDYFAAQGNVVRVAKEVDPRHELAAVASELHREAVVMFDNVRGYSMPVLANLLYTRERFAEGLGVATDGLLELLADAAKHGLPPQVVDGAPCQDVIIEQPDLVKHLPVPTFFEHETGPYITAGVIVARHPVTGLRNVSIARAKLLGGNRLMLGIAPNHHLARMITESLELGRPLELAITIGNSPAVIMASNFYVDYGHDEYEIAGALQGEPLPIVPGRTVDVEVPRDCEIVIEGTVGAEWVTEGPVSEFHGMYENYGQGVVMTATALTHRQDAIFQTILPGYHAEHMLIGAEAIAATILHNVRRSVPSVRDVHVPLSGGGRLQAILTLDNPSPGEAQKAMFAVWAHVNLVKHVTVVDTDIDPRDPEQVGYAVATRFRGEEDLLIVPNVRADRADPLEKDRTITKIGVVALRQPHGSRTEFTPADVPADVRARVRSNWKQYVP